MSETDRIALGVVLLAAGISVVAVLLLEHLMTRRKTGATWRTHLVAFWHVHALSIAVGGLGLGLLLGLGAPAVYHWLHRGGATFNPRIHIAPPRRPHIGGGGGVFTTRDLSFALQGDILNQANTLSCCGNTVAMLDEANRYLRDREVFPDHPISGYRFWWYLEGGANSGSSPDDEAISYNTNGAEGVQYWGPHGVPDATDVGHVTQITGTRVSWDFYQEGGAGDAGVNDLVWQLAHQHPMGILWAVHAQGDAALGMEYTWDGGPFAYYHCLMLVGYTSDLPALGGPAFRAVNWYGPQYGWGGYIWLPAAVVKSHVLGAFAETPGPAVKAWLPPTPTATPTPPPSSTAVPPTSTSTPRPCTPLHFISSRDISLHAAPRLGSRPVAGEGKGQRLTGSSCRVTPHWRYVTDGQRRGGWALKSFVR